MEPLFYFSSTKYMVAFIVAVCPLSVSVSLITDFKVKVFPLKLSY
ncbi:MAG: hypothetical protein WAO74_09135 [Polaribacter sp.]